jgi:hypothetical protein
VLRAWSPWRRMRIGVPQRRQGWRWRPYTVDPPAAAGRVDRRARPAAQVGLQQPVRRREQRPAGRLGQVGQPGEGVDAAGEQDLGLVHVADPGGDPLVHQDGADLVIRRGERRHAVEALVDVGIGPAEVRADVGDRAGAGTERAAGMVPPVRAHHRSGEADGHPVLHLDQRPHQVPGLLPALAGAVQVPGAGHPHVRLQGETALEVDEQVLAHRLDLFDAGARLRAVTRQARRLEADEGLAGQRRPQPGRRSVDGVALGHL